MNFHENPIKMHELSPEFTENTPEADSLDLIEPSQNVNIENTNTIENVVEEKEQEVEEKLFRFPLGTIKRIVKMGMKISYYFNFLLIPHHHYYLILKII